MSSAPRVTGSQPAVNPSSSTPATTTARPRNVTNPSLRALTGTSEFAAAKPTLKDVIKANPEMKTNQDLINYFYRMGKNWDGAQKVAGEYGADLNDLTRNRKGSAQTYAASLQQGVADAPSNVAPPPPAQSELQKLLAAHPEIVSNQHVINYCYRQGGNTWDGAQAVAKGLGTDLNVLVKDRKGAVQAGSTTPATTTPATTTPTTTTPATTTPTTTTPATTTPATTTPAATPLQTFLKAHPEIQTNQHLINYCMKQGGNDWNRAAGVASGLGADLNELVKNRSGSVAAYASSHGSSSPASGPLDVNGQPGQVTATGKLRTAYDDFTKKIAGGLTVDPKYASQIGAVMDKVDDRMATIDAIARQADLPRELVAAIWFRENSSMSTDVYLHNGEKLGKTTTLVPKGIYFGKDQFVEAAVHALGMKSSIKDQLGLHYGSTDFAAMAAYTEAYNGFGYRNKGYVSAYVAAGTNLYQGGRYVADGVFDPNSWDARPGTLAIMAEMNKRFPR